MQFHVYGSLTLWIPITNRYSLIIQKVDFLSKLLKWGGGWGEQYTNVLKEMTLFRSSSTLCTKHPNIKFLNYPLIKKWLLFSISDFAKLDNKLHIALFSTLHLAIFWAQWLVSVVLVLKHLWSDRTAVGSLEYQDSKSWLTNWALFWW